jgi:membrane protease YdiL (CAAX protease family)
LRCRFRWPGTIVALVLHRRTFVYSTGRVIEMAVFELLASAYLIESFERTGNHHPLTWAAAIRASYHLYQGPLGAISIFFLGLAFGAIYRRARDMTLPFIAHTAINTMTLALKG